MNFKLNEEIFNHIFIKMRLENANALMTIVHSNSEDIKTSVILLEKIKNIYSKENYKVILADEIAIHIFTKMNLQNVTALMQLVHSSFEDIKISLEVLKKINDFN